MFENAKWIARERDWGEHNAPILRKVFEVKDAVKTAVLNICGLGYGDYTMNGMRINGDVFTTPFTAYDKRVIYNTYDVTSMLKSGSNVFCAILGNGFYNDIGGWGFSGATWRHAPKLIMQLDITYESGAEEKILSDSSFKTSDSPIIYNHARCGEIYDARLEQPGYMQADFNDAAWEKAVIAAPPGGILEKNKIPPIMEIEELKPVKSKNGVFYFEKNISGYVKIKVRGKCGDKVEIIYSDRLTDDGKADTVCVNRFNNNDVKHTDTYILKGDGEEEWKPRFVYHGFQYAEVRGIYDSIDVIAIRVHTDIQTVGEFWCSDEMINKIHAAARLSTLTNYFGIPTDCPHREQNGWTGDAQISAEQCLMNYDMAALYKKWLNDFRDAQRASGQLPAIIPNPAGWGFTSGGPAWDSTIILLPYYIYHITGDLSAANDMWDCMDAYFDYIDNMSEDGLLINYYSLWDWCPPKDAVICPKEITDMSYYHNDCVKMAVMAKKLGKNADKYIVAEKKVREAFRKRFIKDGIVESDTQTAIACAIGEGFFEADEIPAAAAHLAKMIEENGFHTTCGIIGVKYSFDVLSKYGYAETVYKMVTNPSAPSYAHWINLGMTTLCENWETVDECGEDSSLNHHMYSDVDMWFYKYVAGIQLSEDGLVIKPGFIPGISSARAKHRGIEVRYDERQVYVKTDRPAKVIIKDKIYETDAGEHMFNV